MILASYFNNKEISNPNGFLRLPKSGSVPPTLVYIGGSRPQTLAIVVKVAPPK